MKNKHIYYLNIDNELSQIREDIVKYILWLFFFWLLPFVCIWGLIHLWLSKKIYLNQKQADKLDRKVRNMRSVFYEI